MGGFVVGGAGHAAVGVTAAWVVPGFDPVEERPGERAAVGPVVFVEELELQGAEELSATLLSKQSPMEPIKPSRPALRSRRPNAQDVYWEPWVRHEALFDRGEVEGLPL